MRQREESRMTPMFLVGAANWALMLFNKIGKLTREEGVKRGSFWGGIRSFILTILILTFE